MKSFNTENHHNDIEDGPSNFLNLTESGTQGFLGDHLIADREGPSENPDFHNVSVFLDENPMKKDGPTISDRRPSVVSADSSEQLSFFQRLMRSMGLAPSPLDIARREKYREMLEEMRATGPLKGNRAIDTAVANPKFLKMLEKYDINGDGVIDAEELTVMLNDFHSQKQQSSVLKKVVAGAFLFLIALLICNTLLTFLVIKLTQEVYVDNDTTSMVNSNNEILKTDKPRFYTSISDLTRLPAAALDSITRMTFTTIDGGVYNLLVNGVRLDATANSSVDVYFTSNKRMHIQGNNTAVFMDYDTADGTPTEVAVVLNVDDPLSTLSQSTSRRLSDVEASLGYNGVGTMSSKAGSDRCFSSGVCLYTYEEMISLFDEHGRRLQTASSSSSPSASTMTYTEISADAKILTKDDRAGLSRAQGFLAALLQEEADIKNGTLKVSFIMSDLCANYPTLRDDCRSYPAPQVVYPVNSSNLQDRRPFYGTTAEDGLWMFQDEIEYLLDAYSVQVKVRYAHDPLRDSRRHVVLMSLADTSKFVTYDEVTIQFDPLNPTFPIQSARTYVTNYNSSSSLIPDGTNTFLNGNVSVNTGGRRLLAHNAFLDHVRSKISGFPIINIPEEVLATPVLGSNKNDQMLFMNEVNRRLNAVGSSRNISVDAEMSPDGYCVSTETDVNGNYLPCLSNNVTDVSITYPKSYFSNVWIGTLSGSIAWPNSSSIYSIEPYETTQIVYRSDLKHLLDLQTSNKSTSRRLLSKTSSKLDLAMTFTDEHQEKRITHHLAKKEELREQTQAHFAALDQALGEMLKKHEQRRRLSEMRKTVQRRRLDSDAVDTFQQDAATTHTVINNFGSSLISNDQKEEIRKKLSSALGNEVNSFFTQIVNSALSSVPMRHGSTCTQFHGLMGQMLQDIADLNDVIVKAIQYSSNIDQSLDDIKELQSMLGDLISINNLMKPIMPAIGSIPYVGSVAKVFQNAFNTIVTDPVTPAKKYVDDIQSELTQWKIQVYNDKFLIVAENISTAINDFVFDATTFGDVLVAIDDSCLWTPTTVKGVVTYNYTLTGQTCSEINVVLRQALSDIDLIKSQVNLFLGRIQQVSNLVNIATIFIKTFDASLISTIQSVFSVIGSFLNRQISACIPWICFTSRQVCSTVSYPCGVKRCRTAFGHIPCGIKFCSDNECVSVPEPYDCPQCASFTVQEIINGVMAVASQLQQIIMNALNSLAQALGISFPMVSIPGLPSVNFMSGIESFLSNLFDDVLDATMLNTLTKDLNSILSKFNLNSLVCNK